MSTSHAPTSHIAPMVTRESAAASQAAANEQKHMPLSPMQRAHIRIYSAILQGVEEYGDNVVKIPFWQLLHAHTLMGGKGVVGGGVRINTEVEWTRRDCPQALKLAFDSALMDKCKLFPVIGSSALRKVPDHYWAAAQLHRSMYGRYSLGAVAVKNGDVHPEDRPIAGIILFDDVGRTMLAEGNIAAVVAGKPISDLIKDLTATKLFRMLPGFVRQRDEQTQFLVNEYYKMSEELGVLNTNMGFSIGQSWNSFSVEQYVPAPVEPALTAPAAVVEAPVVEPKAAAPVVKPVVEAPAPAVEPVAEYGTRDAEDTRHIEDPDLTGIQSEHERGVSHMRPTLMEQAAEIVEAAPVAAVAPAPAPAPAVVEVEVDDLFAELTPEQEFARAKADLQNRLKIATTKVAACTRELAASSGSHSVIYITRLEKATEEVQAIKTEAIALKAKYGKGA